VLNARSPAKERPPSDGAADPLAEVEGMRRSAPLLLVQRFRGRADEDADALTAVHVKRLLLVAHSAGRRRVGRGQRSSNPDSTPLP